MYIVSFSEIAGQKHITLLKRDSGTDVFLWIFEKQILRKSYIVDVRLGSKFALASDGYW